MQATFWRKLEPGEARESMHTLQMCFDLPAGAAHVQASMQLTKTLLYVHEYPPDAHRGFDIAATRVLAAEAGACAAADAAACAEAAQKHWLADVVCACAWHVATTSLVNAMH